MDKVLVDQNNAQPVLSPLPQDADSLAQLLAYHCKLQPHAPALIIDNQSFSYQELVKKVCQLAAFLKLNNIQRLGILASKSLAAYVGLLAAQWLGIAYVPLNPMFPELRLKKIIYSAQLDGMLVDAAYSSLGNHLLAAVPASVKPISLTDLTEQANFAPAQGQDTDLAYLIYTSGSAGEPKGVTINYGNFASFIRVVKSRYQLSAADRVSQFSALAFDVSLFDMCLAFGNGAALYVVPDDIRLAPGKFIQENQLTVWLAVPSIISNMAKLKMLKANNFPSLKLSLFTGEALSATQAQLWLAAAPASQLENLYGPTEVTIDCVGHSYQDHAKGNAYRDQVAIGRPFPAMLAALIDEHQQFLAPGAKGELVIAGPQVAVGYWQDAGMTAKKFKNLKHPQWGMQRWYLTGDYCYQDSDEVFYYLSRLDNQCKVLGNRVELEEIEFTVRDITGSHNVMASAIDDEIIVVTDIARLDVAALENELKERLPIYMLPTHFLYRDSLIKNANGKLDRREMMQWVRGSLNRGDTI